MKSPFTGGGVTLHHELSKVTYRKEEFEYIASYYFCEDTQTPFTVDGMDDVNMIQVRNQYRVKYGIPFEDEIRQMRESYGLSAIKMSTILGFGDNQYRLYENGEMPSLSNGRLLKSIMKPSTFRQFVEAARSQLGEKEYSRIIRMVAEKETESALCGFEAGLVFDRRERGAENGYAEMSVSRLENVMLFFIEHCENVFNTKMNKLLFYLDMVSYRESGFAMTGLAYKAIQFGPVPVHWDRVYSLVDGIRPEIVGFASGAQGVKLVGNKPADMSVFTETEKKRLLCVADRFATMSSVEISEVSHEEDAWKNAISGNRLVDFNDAFSLKAI